MAAGRMALERYEGAVLAGNPAGCSTTTPGRPPSTIAWTAYRARGVRREDEVTLGLWLRRSGETP